MTDNKKSYIFALITVLMWSTVPTMFKLTLRHYSVYQFVFISSLTSTIVFIPFLIKSKPSIHHFFRNLKSSMITGILNPFLYYVILLKAYSLLPAQLAQPLNMIWPITLVLLSIIFLKHKMKKIEFIPIFFCLIGVLIIATEGDFTSLNFSSPYGVFLALISSIIWSSYWILNVKSKLESELKLFYNFLVGTVISGIFMLTDLTSSSSSLNGFYGAVYIGFFEMGIAFLLWFKAMKLTKNSSNIAKLIYIAPFLSLYLLTIFVGEEIRVSTIIGALVIIVSIFFHEKVKISSSDG
ncbi:MAG: DMT family transporter [Candidatus Delongbacteria bacterium]|nr:DMT family transporter [Candidatus Delongbacteria bacterium]MBN2834910.1 DMT family transporter [Candidatus Delongbacteria bacterium]